MDPPCCTCQVGPCVCHTLSRQVAQLEEAKMGPSGPEPGHTVSDLDRCIETYIERCRNRIPSFVDANFSLRQTWKLQRPTVWLDLVFAPVNSVWALPRLAFHKVAETTERVGHPRLARWAKRLPPGIKTGYQRKIERRICEDLLEWDLEHSPSTLPQGLLKELEADHPLRRVESPELKRGDRTPARTLVDLLHQFSSGRAVVSDLSGTLLTLATSWAILGSTSLSLSTIAHDIAKKRAHDRAASRFFLGKRVGSAFYHVFPPTVHQSTIWMILGVLGAALAVGVMVCTILSDPIRKRLGFQRNRLELLLDEMERELIVLAHKRMRSCTVPIRGE